MKQLRSFYQWAGSPLIQTYAGILFSSNCLVGLLLLAATFSYPTFGFMGVIGTWIALFVGRALGFDSSALQDGRLLFNSMLCSLGLAYWTEIAPISTTALFLLLPLTSISALAVSVLLNQISFQLTGAASRSLPFCLVSIVLHWILASLRPEFYFSTPSVPSFFPEMVQLWCHSLGAILFSGTIAGGLLMTCALVISSRISLLHAILGFSVSLGVQQALEYSGSTTVWLNLNAMLCAVALGGIFYVPSRSSFAVAATAAAICTCMGMALQTGLGFINAPALTLPFNLTLICINVALRWREPGRFPVPALNPGHSPEQTYRRYQLNLARLPDATLPSIMPPFDGAWIVTQGFNGGITHRENWQYALDFEVANEKLEPARPPQGSLSDYPSFDAPILSPVQGRVVRVVNDIRDNAIGEINLSENWGNSVVIEIHAQLYLQLSHFRCRSIKVREGDRVRTGQVIGFLGNSGRSPVPHLHLQMQTQPEIGAPTLPFRFHSFRTFDPDGSRFCFRGLPREGQVVVGQCRRPWAEECFVRPDLTSHSFRIFSREGEKIETVSSSPKPDGSFLMISASAKAFLHYTIQEGVLIPLAFRGSSQSILSALYLCGRIPLLAVTDTEWFENLDESSRHSEWDRVPGDLLAPYSGSQLARARARMLQVDALGKKFTCEWQLPRGEMARFSFDAEGLASGQWEGRNAWFRFHRADLPEQQFKPDPASRENQSIPASIQVLAF